MLPWQRIPFTVSNHILVGSLHSTSKQTRNGGLSFSRRCSFLIPNSRKLELCASRPSSTSCWLYRSLNSMPPRRRSSERGSLRSGGGQWLDNFDPQRISILRTDKWRAQKRAYIQERKDQLKEMFQQDLENDDRALKRDWVEKRGVVNSTSPNPYLGPSIFDSRSMDGSRGYVLSDISRYLKANLRPSLLEDINSYVKDKAWIDKELGGFGDVRSTFMSTIQLG
jgi:hypothetical protein